MERRAAVVLPSYVGILGLLGERKKAGMATSNIVLLYLVFLSWYLSSISISKNNRSVPFTVVR